MGRRRKREEKKRRRRRKKEEGRRRKSRFGSLEIDISLFGISLLFGTLVFASTHLET